MKTLELDEYTKQVIQAAADFYGVPVEELTKPIPKEPRTFVVTPEVMNATDYGPVRRAFHVLWARVCNIFKRKKRFKNRVAKNRRVWARKMLPHPPGGYMVIDRAQKRLRQPPAKFMLIETPYHREIIAAMDPTDKSNEVIIMKGCSHGPTITPGVAAKLYMTDRDGKQTFLGNVSRATITKDGIKKDL